MINEVLEQSREILKKIMESQTRIESIERAKQAVLEGQLSILLPDGNLIDIPVSNAQADSIKAQILVELDLTVAEAVNFLYKINDSTRPEERVRCVDTTQVKEQTPSKPTDYDLDLVIRELKNGLSVGQISRKYYPEHTDSWLYKKLNRDKIDFKAIAAGTTDSDINADEWYVLDEAEDNGRQL